MTLLSGVSVPVGVGQDRVATPLLACRWTLTILWALFQGRHRPSELQRHIPGLRRKVLYDRLRKLQGEGLVVAVTGGGYPLRVEYHPTERGMALRPVVEALLGDGIPPAVVAEVLKCKWMGCILRLLRERPYRPSELKRALGGISNKVLAERLAKLEALGLVQRQVVATRGVRVLYALTPLAHGWRALGMVLAPPMGPQ
ncbi:MAG: helix-turn-helix transcriptional regulator [Dehalococcoidia bacterium]|nr:helix-turn-helix transcriptional regulator [Dehalococcoidia bacterium]MDW8120546.1 helix-turn-helix domain-containing protein [Chloroflexota bacterium]